MSRWTDDCKPYVDPHFPIFAGPTMVRTKTKVKPGAPVTGGPGRSWSSGSSGSSWSGRSIRSSGTGGTDGDPGPMGPAWPQGPIGPMGLPGPAGPTGPTLVIGVTGSSDLGIVNVKDWGAVGDGSNATVAVQAAVDACIGLGGGTVFFPTGRYGVSEPLIVGSDAEDVGVRLIGSGRSATILVKSGYSDPDGVGYVISGGDKVYDCLEAVESMTGDFTVRGTRAGCRIFNCQAGSAGTTFDLTQALNGCVEGCDIAGLGRPVNDPPPQPNIMATTPNSIGVALGSGGKVSNCGIRGGYEVAVALSGAGCSLICVQTETVGVGCRVGWGTRDDLEEGVGELPCTGAVVTGHNTERCWIGLDLYNVDSAYIAGNLITMGDSGVWSSILCCQRKLERRGCNFHVFNPTLCPSKPTSGLALQRQQHRLVCWRR